MSDESDQPPTSVVDEPVPLSAPPLDDASEVETLRVTRRESRSVLDRKLARLDDINDRAMRTVRTSVLVFSILFSVVGYARLRDVALFDGGGLSRFTAALGLVLLFETVVLGILTYTVTRDQPGIGDSYRVDVRDESYSEREWLLVLLAGYDEWIAAMRTSIEANRLQLVVVQGTLLLSFYLFLASLGLLYLSPPAVGLGLVLLAAPAGLFLKATEWETMVRSPKSERELEPERGSNAPAWLQRLLGWPSDGTTTDDENCR